jgi:hypothetical protein
VEKVTGEVGELGGICGEPREGLREQDVGGHSPALQRCWVTVGDDEEWQRDESLFENVIIITTIKK